MLEKLFKRENLIQMTTANNKIPIEQCLAEWLGPEKDNHWSTEGHILLIELKRKYPKMEFHFETFPTTSILITEGQVSVVVDLKDLPRLMPLDQIFVRLEPEPDW